MNPSRLVLVVLKLAVSERREQEQFAQGADYQLYDKSLKRTELEAIYCIRTDDGTNIHVRNCGILTTGNGETYFRTSPRFEAPIGSPYECRIMIISFLQSASDPRIS